MIRYSVSPFFAAALFLLPSLSPLCTLVLAANPHMFTVWCRRTIHPPSTQAAGSEIDCENDDGNTALHEAAKEGHVEMVQLLLEHKAAINYVNDLGDSPLHMAVESGSLDTASLLLESGALPGCKNIRGLSPRAQAHTYSNEMLEVFEAFASQSGESLDTTAGAADADAAAAAAAAARTTSGGDGASGGGGEAGGSPPAASAGMGGSTFLTRARTRHSKKNKKGVGLNLPSSGGGGGALSAALGLELDLAGGSSNEGGGGGSINRDDPSRQTSVDGIERRARLSSGEGVKEPAADGYEYDADAGVPEIVFDEKKIKKEAEKEAKRVTKQAKQEASRVAKEVKAVAKKEAARLKDEAKKAKQAEKDAAKAEKLAAKLVAKEATAAAKAAARKASLAAAEASAVASAATSAETEACEAEAEAAAAVAEAVAAESQDTISEVPGFKAVPRAKGRTPSKHQGSIMGLRKQAAAAPEEKPGMYRPEGARKLRGFSIRATHVPATAPPAADEGQPVEIAVEKSPTGLDITYAMDEEGRLRVVDCAPRGAADKAGIWVGATILEINQLSVVSLRSAEDALREGGADGSTSTTFKVTACEAPVPHEAERAKARRKSQLDEYEEEDYSFYKTVVVRRVDGELPFNVADTEDGVVVIASQIPELKLGTTILGVMGEKVLDAAHFLELAGDDKFTLDVQGR
jgi:cell division septum initiation protein DivIVA